MLRWNKIVHIFIGTSEVHLTSPNLFKKLRYSEYHHNLRNLIIKLIKKKYTYKHISNYLNLNGYRTSTGKKFSPILVSMFLYKLKKRLIGYLELEIISVKLKKLKIDRNKIKDYLIY